MIVDQLTPPSLVRHRCVGLLADCQGTEANPSEADEKTSLATTHDPWGSDERVVHDTPPFSVRCSA